MALTLEVEQRLDAAGMVAFLEKGDSKWSEFAVKAYEFVRDNYPPDAKIRRDDVAKALIPLLTVDEDLGDFLDAHKLRQKYWIRDFADLIIERDWPVLETNHGKKKRP